jgi:putative SOS response-associated peptidase YedK
MCNLYSMNSNAEAIRQFANHMRDIVGNLPVQTGIFPDYSAPIVRNAPDGVRELAMARWGMPSSHPALMDSAQKRAAKLEAKGWLRCLFSFAGSTDR